MNKSKSTAVSARWVGTAAAVTAAVLLSGCWGDADESAPAVTSQVPASASESGAGFVAYLQALVASDADALEPVNTESVTPPAGESAEPTPLG